MRRGLVALVVALVVALGAGTVGPAAATAAENTPPRLTVPADWGVVDFGDRVPVALDAGLDCGTVQVWVEASAGTTVRGPVSSACDGATLPGLEQAQAAGVTDAGAVDVELHAVSGAGSTTVPLQLQRVQAELAEPVAGTPSVVAIEGGSALALQPGDAARLGPVSLAGIDTASVRFSVTEGAGVCSADLGVSAVLWCALPTLELRDGVGGPVVATTQLPATSGQSTRVTFPVTSADPVDLVVAVSGRLGEVVLDHLELNGSGAAAPHVFAPDPPGTVTLFDGTSFDGWEHVGPGGFELRDGAMRATHNPDDPFDGGYGLLWYPGSQFDDFVLRLEFKTEAWTDNSGIFVRFADPEGSPDNPALQAYELQIDDRGANILGTHPLKQTGAVYDNAAAERIASSSVGEWNTYEVVAVGQRYTVRINGRTVTTFTGDKESAGYIGVQNESPGHVWFRNIRIYECASAGDVACM